MVICIFRLTVAEFPAKAGRDEVQPASDLDQVAPCSLTSAFVYPQINFLPLIFKQIFYFSVKFVRLFSIFDTFFFNLPVFALSVPLQFVYSESSLIRIWTQIRVEQNQKRVHTSIRRNDRAVPAIDAIIFSRVLWS